MTEVKIKKLRPVGEYVVIRKDGTREPPKPLYAPTEEIRKPHGNDNQSSK